jgi:hypothetical protein
MLLLAVAVVSALAAGGAVALVLNVFERKQEARTPFFRVVELTDDTVDPEVWGKNFPLQYDGYKRTVDQVRTRYGGSEAVPHTPTQVDPRSVTAQRRTRGRRCSRRSTRSSSCGIRASTRARAWPARTATCPTRAPGR